MFRYAFKRVVRGYRLFIALTIGVLIATTFFASMLMAADMQSQAALNQSLEGVTYDGSMVASQTVWNTSTYNQIQQTVESMPEVSNLDRYTKFSFTYNKTETQSFDIYGVEPNSAVWQSLTFVNGSTTLQANETLVVASSVNASLFSIGQVVSVPIVYYANSSPVPKSFTVNLTVSGFCDIDDQTAQLLNPQRVINIGPISIPFGDYRDYDLMLVNWQQTVEPILNYYSAQANATGLVANTGFFIQLNRNLLVNPYDIGASSTNIQNALYKIEDRTAIYNAKTTNLIGPTLSMLSLVAGVLVLGFIALAVPVIFMAWYSSTMLSDVSYNLRRREFGLLQTKGFGPKSIRRMLLLEGVIIGLIGGTVGLFIGTYLASVIVNVTIASPFIALYTSPLNAAATIAFGVIIAYWSVRGPSSRAAKLDPLDSLKQYVYVEEQSEYKRLLPYVALALGSYKLIVWILGINMTTLLGAASSNFLLLILVAFWSPVDAFLNFAGPIAFLYGATKILLRGSQRFQEAVVGAGRKFFGAFGNLATRNVKRNPARNAALVFVVALIVAYGIFSVGSLASEQNLRTRTDLYNVGSNVNVVFNPGYNDSTVVSTVDAITGVESSTIEYQISLSTTRGTLQTRAIDPSSWEQSAYHENGWFTGGSVDSLLSNFTGQEIILSVAVARQLDLDIGNMITLLMPSGPSYQMRITGLTGYRSPLENLFGGALGEFAFGGSYPSYIPFDFLNQTGYTQYAEQHVLIKTAEGVNGTAIEQQLQQLYPNYKSTDSTTTQEVNREASPFQMGATRARWLGVTFAVVLAIIGTGLIVSLTLREKEYETTLLSVRGFTTSQVHRVLLAEIMVMMLFSVILGLGTGMIQLFGDVSNTSQSTQSLVRPIIVLDPITVALMGLIILAIVLSAVVPILLTSRFSEKKIDVLRE